MSPSSKALLIVLLIIMPGGFLLLPMVFGTSAKDQSVRELPEPTRSSDALALTAQDVRISGI